MGQWYFLIFGLWITLERSLALETSKWKPGKTISYGKANKLRALYRDVIMQGHPLSDGKPRKFSAIEGTKVICRLAGDVPFDG